MMIELFLVLLTVVILIMFIAVTAQNLPRRRKRNDERDTYKASDIERHPALLDHSQQAAELQIGEADEALHLSRFQPDAKEQHRAAASGKR